jgi:hypothetical protein
MLDGVGTLSSGGSRVDLRPAASQEFGAPVAECLDGTGSRGMPFAVTEAPITEQAILDAPAAAVRDVALDISGPVVKAPQQDAPSRQIQRSVGISTECDAGLAHAE